MTTKSRKQWNESAFTRWFCKCVERVGAVTVPIVGSTMQQSGIPDRYVSHSQFQGWLEFKKADSRLRDIQRIFIMRLIRSGSNVMIVRWRSNDMIYFEGVDNYLLGTLDLKELLALSNDLQRGFKLLAALKNATELERTNEL